MAIKETWYGTHGPYIHDDATVLDPDNETGSQFSGSMAKAMSSDSPARIGVPVDPEDAMRASDVQGVYQVIEVADISNPTELNSISGEKTGSTALAVQKISGGYDYVTIYSYDADGPSVNSPKIVDAAGSSTERWIAIAGRYQANLFNVDEIVSSGKPAPPISALGEGKFYFDENDFVYKVSENGDDYSPLMGTRRLNTDLTETVISNTTVETELCSFTLKGNRLRTENVVEAVLNFPSFNIADGDSITFRLYYGGVVVASGTISNNSNSNITNNSGKSHCVLVGDNSLTAQQGFMAVDMGAGNFPSASEAGTSAHMSSSGSVSVDSTQDQAFKMTAQWSVASTSNSITKNNGFVQLVQ